MPEEVRGPIEGLLLREALLSETAAALRELNTAATLEFETAASVSVAGILPDGYAGPMTRVVTDTPKLNADGTPILKAIPTTRKP